MASRIGQALTLGNTTDNCNHEVTKVHLWINVSGLRQRLLALFYKSFSQSLSQQTNYQAIGRHQLKKVHNLKASGSNSYPQVFNNIDYTAGNVYTDSELSCDTLLMQSLTHGTNGMKAHCWTSYTFQAGYQCPGKCVIYEGAQSNEETQDTNEDKCSP